MLMIGIGISITMPYLPLYFTGAFGVFMAVSSLSGVVINSLIAKRSDVSILNGLGAAVIPQIYAYAQESANASQSDDKTLAISALRSLVSLGFLVGPLGGTLLLAAAG